MTSIDIKTLTEWLGPDGAVAGLEKSNLTNAELMVIARNYGQIVDKKASRHQIAIELVMSRVERIDKPIDFLLQMSANELQRYFVDRQVSTKEIKALLQQLELVPTGTIRGKLSEYAAREIGELGLFQRISKGTKQQNLSEAVSKNR